MTAESITKAVVVVDSTPGGMIRTHSESFTAVLPTHIKPETWVRLAQGALKKGKKVKIGDSIGTELELAALNNPGVFMAALLDAARLGLEPGTEQYYLTPRAVYDKQTKTKPLQILGIVGYQGYIELMYRAGAISSVVAECVYTNDKFVFQPGRMERPDHEIDWDAEDRGKLRLVYAYGVMKDGATSKVVVLNRAAIDKIKESSPGSEYENSPWQKHEHAMWLKSSVRQLAKWVPTSAERVLPVTAERVDVPAIPAAPESVKQLGNAWVEADDDEGKVYDGELVDDNDPYLPGDPDLTAGGA